MDSSFLKPGDLIGFSGKGYVSDLINLGTWRLPRWGLSHIGVVAIYRDKKYLFESTTLNGDDPCDITGKVVSGVQAHHIDDIYERPGKVWHYPLLSPLYTQEKKRLTLKLVSLLGVPYDMVGAARSAGFLFRLFESCIREENLSSFFCSELCAEALTTVGRARILNVSGQSPNSLVRGLYNNGVIRQRRRIK